MMLQLLRTLIRSAPSRFTLKNGDHDPMHLVAATPVSTEVAPTPVEVVVVPVLRVVRAVRAALSPRMLVVAPSSNEVGRLAALRPKDVAKPKLFEASIPAIRLGSIHL